MPLLFIHIAVAKEVLKKVDLNEREFLFGNILPDFSNISKDHDIRRKQTHFEKEKELNGIKFPIPNLEEVRKYLNLKNKDSIELGIYSHLYTDAMWIKDFIKKHKEKINGKNYIKTKDGLVEDNREIIYEDYNVMTKEIIDKYKIDIDFIKQCKYIGNLKELYNVETDKIYNEMKEYMTIETDEELKIFTMEEIYEFIRSAKDKIIKELKEIIGEENV